MLKKITKHSTALFFPPSGSSQVHGAVPFNDIPRPLNFRLIVLQFHVQRSSHVHQYTLSLISDFLVVFKLMMESVLGVRDLDLTPRSAIK